MKLRHWICNCPEGIIYPKYVKYCKRCESEITFIPSTRVPKQRKEHILNCWLAGIEIKRLAFSFNLSEQKIHKIINSFQKK